MADKKISQLTAAAALTGTETLPIVQGGQTVKATAQDVANLAPDELPTQVVGDAGKFLQADGVGGVSYQTAVGVLPVLNTYPVTTPASAGTRFWYKGNEWHYMTANEIASAGWTGLVSVGFPAPVNKTVNPNILCDGVDIVFGYAAGTFPNFFMYPGPASFAGKTFTVDHLGWGDPTRVAYLPHLTTGGPVGSYNISFRNVSLLKNLQNFGTGYAVSVEYSSLSAAAINTFFTELPPTTKTVTLNFRNNTGSATCNPTIATSKGYTVLV